MIFSYDLSGKTHQDVEVLFEDQLRERLIAWAGTGSTARTFRQPGNDGGLMFEVDNSHLACRGRLVIHSGWFEVTVLMNDPDMNHRHQEEIIRAWVDREMAAFGFQPRIRVA